MFNSNKTYQEKSIGRCQAVFIMKYCGIYIYKNKSETYMRSIPWKYKASEQTEKQKEDGNGLISICSSNSD